MREFTAVIELAPHYPGAYTNRAIAHYARGDYDAAWSDVKTRQRLGGKMNPEFLRLLRNASPQAP